MLQPKKGVFNLFWKGLSWSPKEKFFSSLFFSQCRSILFFGYWQFVKLSYSIEISLHIDMDLLYPDCTHVFYLYIYNRKDRNYATSYTSHGNFMQISSTHIILLLSRPFWFLRYHRTCWIHNLCGSIKIKFLTLIQNVDK